MKPAQSPMMIKLRGEVNRVSATLINLMEQDLRAVAGKAGA
jgi:hypothetical protein